ncbi:putative BNR repeat domain protein [Monocercomonoides exilis]|uniref:putative BNR repeat domain protein n=1 Tax=Monocercomonoides exilis TaxID=2049356 RepID=UPI00355A5ECD|nr:putative BNR repeat domain protein [Monocercomonoides exilis]|eukprot:MONOS_2428.1-p1 / transcript=MONOS_2428.1 / gene=MONOS_2428 / organism=Monocercomonoides_exilis_PA203 / gene_product=BNR repeat domain protein / transcript_product=BNR repeat domain protein / location=Mono_scaffold00050:34729-36417(+) / protein_length=562 / sequence_SO=supercontig / SO=protein_coding / is_pseudo=false
MIFSEENIVLSSNLSLLPPQPINTVYEEGSYVQPGNVWIWGEGKGGILGAKTDAEGDVCFPEQVPGLTAIVHVSASINVSCAVSVNGDLYMWGKNSQSRILFHPNEALLSVPQKIRFGPHVRIKSCHLSEGHACAVTAEKTLLFWGNGHHGCIGDGNAAAHMVTVPFAALLPAKVEQACVSLYGTMVLLTDGRVFASGLNTYGRLGLGSVSETAEFVITSIPRSRFISLGSLYGLAISLEGKVYGFGYGGHGNLGIGMRVLEQRIPTEISLSSSSPIIKVSALVGQPNLKEQPVKETSSRALPSSSSAPSPSDSLKLVKVPEGSEGPTSFAVNACGEVFAWGTAHKGKLGNCREKVMNPKGCDELRPVKLGHLARDLEVKNKKAGKGPRFAGLLKKEETKGKSRKVEEECDEISFHQNKDCEREEKKEDEKEEKRGKSNSSLYPDVFHGEHIIQAGGAHIHSFCLSDLGTLYTFGCGSDGRLGLDGFMRGGRKNRLKFYQSIPTGVETLLREDVAVQFVASSRYHMVAIGVHKKDIKKQQETESASSSSSSSSSSTSPSSFS